MRKEKTERRDGRERGRRGRERRRESIPEVDHETAILITQNKELAKSIVPRGDTHMTKYPLPAAR